MDNNTIIDIPTKPFLAMQCWSTQGRVNHLNQEQQLGIYEDAIMRRGVGHIKDQDEHDYIKALMHKYGSTMDTTDVDRMTRIVDYV